MALHSVSLATSLGCARRQLSRSMCSWWSSSKKNLPKYDRRSVDDLTDEYDHEMYGSFKGDLPEDRRTKERLATGDYESFYHLRLPRVPEYELPKEVASDFLQFNTVVYPPQLDASEPRRPAETCVEVDHVGVDSKALVLFGMAVSGLSVEEALSKLSVLAERRLQSQFKKLGHLAPLAIKQAIEAGVRQMMEEEAVEFQSNMWVESVQALRSGSYKIVTKSTRWTLMMSKRPYSLLRVRLQEGKPPKIYHPSDAAAYQNNWLPNREIIHKEKEKLRAQRIYNEL